VETTESFEAVTMDGWKKVALKKSVGRVLTFDRTAVVGLVLLMSSSVMGALLRNSAQITDGSVGRIFHGTCDTYVRGLCIPTAYLSIPLGPIGFLVINATSFLVSATFFVPGVVLIRK
jgi:hypothetical protein